MRQEKTIPTSVFRTAFIVYGIIFVAIIIALFIRLSGNNRDYRQDILSANNRIEGLENKAKEKEAETERFKKAAAEASEDLKASKRRMGKRDKTIEILKKDLKETKDKERYKDLDPSEIVLRTRIALDCEDVWSVTLEARQRLVMSFDCSRVNLSFLDGYKKADKLALELDKNYSECKGALKTANTESLNLTGAVKSQSETIIFERNAKLEWENKFNLCTNEKRKKWWKGCLVGVAVGAGITVVFVSVLMFSLK